MPHIIDNRYELLKKLGCGAMGDVYKAQDLKNNQIIALKIISKEMTSSEAVQRFKREFRLLADLHHPNLCQVYDFGTVKDGRSYFTMEYIDGEDIFHAAQGLPYTRVYPWIVELCRALEYTHAKGLIHYDIKPSNILIETVQRSKGAAEQKSPMRRSSISSFPHAKLLDFGLAGEQRIKGDILVKGTIPYIAPEVIEGLAVDSRADLYSLGVLLYEIFTKKRLRMTGKTSFVSLIRQHQELASESARVLSNLPKDLSRLILRLLALEPAERYSQANEVIRETSKIAGMKFEIETEKTIDGYLLSSRFVGRDKELALLKAFHERAKQGEGRVILITGDAGIGKSRLLKEFRVLAQLERSHCFIGYTNKEKTTPLQPFYDIFRETINFITANVDLKNSGELRTSLAVLFKLFPELTNGHLTKNLPELVPLAPQAEKLRTFEALSELVRMLISGLGDLVILLEDLHWADDLTLQFLEYLGRNLQGSHILICGTCRKEALPENQVLKQMIVNSSKEGYLNQIELGSLSLKNLYSFLDSTITPASNSSELAKYLMRKTGGNPFYVEEMMRTLLKTGKVSIGKRIEVAQVQKIPIPTKVEDIVTNRIKDLDRNAERIVKCSAILLRDFNYDFMKLLTALEDADLSRCLWELRRRQILIERDNRYQFYHPTLQETMIKRLGDEEKRELNYQVGKVLETISKKNIERVVEDLAHYYITAQDKRKGIPYGLRAAKKSNERYAHEQARKSYEGVLALLGNEDIKLHFDVLQELAKTENFAGDYDGAIKHYRKALSMKIIGSDERVKIALNIAHIYSIKGEYTNALHMLRKAEEFLRWIKDNPKKILFKAFIKAAACLEYLTTGDYKRADRFNFSDLELPEENLNDTDLIRIQASTFMNIGTIRELRKKQGSRVDESKTISNFNEAHRLYKKVHDWAGIANVLTNIANVYYYSQGPCPKAYHYYQEAIKISKKIRDQTGVLRGYNNLGVYFEGKGNYAKALDYYQRTLQISQVIGNMAIEGDALLKSGNTYFSLCRYEEARIKYFQALKVLDSINWLKRKIYALRGVGSTYKAVAEYASALKFYRKGINAARQIGYQYGLANLHTEIGSLFLEMGNFLAASRNSEAALKIARAGDIKDVAVECYVVICRHKIAMKEYDVARNFCRLANKTAKECRFRSGILQSTVLASEICFYKTHYLKGGELAQKAIAMAKIMETKDLYVEALLLKTKNGMRLGVLSKMEGFKILDEAIKIAEEIRCPEILWKAYFEYGKFCHDDKKYRKASKYYQQCIDVFRAVVGKLKSESSRQGYLNRPDRKTALETMRALHKEISGGNVKSLRAINTSSTIMAGY